MGKDELKASYKIAVLASTVVAVSLFAWFLVQYLQQRPWPPELAGPMQSISSGDSYTLTWSAASTGPTPEFYYLEKSDHPAFASPSRYTVKHDTAKSQQQSPSIVASVVSAPSQTIYYRVLSGYKSKFFSSSDILSDPSNTVFFAVTPISDPTVMTPSPVFSGQSYTISWTAIGKANGYRLEETKPNNTKTKHDVNGTSKTFLAPPLAQDGSFSYRVKAANAAGGTWVFITNWSNTAAQSVKHVKAPANLKVGPAAVHHPQQYKVSWTAPAGPSPTSSYSYTLRETRAAQAPKMLPSLTQTSYTGKAPSVASSTNISYEVRANLGNNPMTLFSEPVKVTVIKPPAQPAPSITKVAPTLAPKGATVTLTGTNLAAAKIELYSSATKKSVAIGTPTSQTATKIVFKVPTAASLKTTHIRVAGGNQKPFQVARKAGNFIERQKNVQLISQTVGKFKAEVDPPNYPDLFPARFKEGSQILVSFPSPGFKATNVVITGLGFSKSGNVGVQVGTTQSGIVQPAYINFYNLGVTQDSAIGAGQKIVTNPSPIGIEPSVFFKGGYKLLFSPDETLAAVVNRNTSGPLKLRIVIFDMLTGKALYGDQFSNPTFTLNVDTSNKISFKGGTGSPKLITIPVLP